MAPIETPLPTPGRRRDLIQVANYVAILVLVGVLLVWARLIVVALVVGLGVGAILAPVLERMQRQFRIPRGIAAALIALLGLALVAGTGWAIAGVVDSQASLLADRGPALMQRLQQISHDLLQRFPWLQKNVASMDIGGTASSVGTAVFKGAWSSVGTLSALLFSTVLGLYLATDARAYRDGAVRAIPARHRERAHDFLGKAAKVVRTWFGAQLIDMLIIGTLTSVGLWIVGADYWLLLGVMTGALGIIPYVGILIVVTFAALLTLASDVSRLPLVLGVFLVTQQAEGHLILPMVMRGKVQLPAVPLLVIMLLMGSWAGLLGVLIAPPLFAVLRLAYIEFYLPRMDAMQNEGEEPSVEALTNVPGSGNEPRAKPGASAETTVANS